MSRQNISSGSPWESSVGYSRAVRVGNHVFVSGTTATNELGEVVSSDPFEQARFVFQKIGAALQSTESSFDDVVRTRMFVTDISLWEAFGRAHHQFLGDVCPAATMVEVKSLINPACLIEIEVDAIVP